MTAIVIMTAIYAFCIEFKIPRHFRILRKHGIYNKKKPRNLHNNISFSRRYITSNVIVMENYK